MTQGDIDKEIKLRMERLSRLMPTGLLLRRGQGRCLTRDLSRLRQLALQLHRSIWYADLSIDLGYVYHRLDIGDPSENTERAIRYVEDALGLLNEGRNPEEWARACTTIGMLYNERRREGERSNYAIAEEYLRAALRVRSRAKSQIDWAFTASNLAESLCRSSVDYEATEAIGRLDESFRLHDEAAEAFTSRADLVGIAMQAKINGGVALLQKVTRMITGRQVKLVIEHDLVALLLGPEPETDTSSTPLFSPYDLVLQMCFLADLNPGAFNSISTPDWAQIIVEGSRPQDDELVILRIIAEIGQIVAERQDSGEVRARALKLAADAILKQDGDLSRATDTYQAAIDSFGDVYDPTLLSEIGMQAGQGWIERHNWERASTAHLATISAINELYTVRHSILDQEVELARFPKLIELSAYALIRCGRLEQAVRTLEHGRARELTRSLLRTDPDLSRVRPTNPGVVSRIESIIENVRDGETRAQGEIDGLFKNVLSVGQLPYFGTSADDFEICQASIIGRPLVYLVSAPSGSACLCVKPGSQELEAELVSDSKVTSAQLVLSQYKLDIKNRNLSGILSRDDGSLEQTLDHLARMLGDVFGHNLGNYLEAQGVQSVVIVAAGLLGTSPLSATTVHATSTNRTRRLLDITAITVAPSAAAFLALQRRAARSPNSHDNLVCLGDAERDVPGRRLEQAESEIREVSKYFDKAAVLVGNEANSIQLLNQIDQASVLHFACHGYADHVNPRNSYLALSDRRLMAD